MKPELEDALINDFPLLYMGGRFTHFDCDDGWEPIIRELSKEIYLLDELDESYTHVEQVKEKFGTMRYYTDSPDLAVLTLISDYERRTAYTCEFCGSEGKLRSGSWLKTLCDPCHAEWKLRRSPPR